jgi:hypothetical protein
MSAAPAAAPALSSDIACGRCGYNLRGLSLAANCPECGASVRTSLGGNRFKLATSAWLKAVRSGGYMIVWSVGITIASAVVLAMELITQTTPRGPLAGRLSEPFCLVCVVLIVSASVALMLGVWRVTRREHFEQRRITFWRWTSRICSAAPLAMVSLALAMFAFGHRTHLYFILPLAVLGGCGSHCLYLEYLMDGLPDRAAAKNLRAAGIAIFTCAGLWALVFVLEFTLRRLGVAAIAIAEITPVLALIAMVSLLVAAAYFLMMLIEQARFSREMTVLLRERSGS